MVHDWLTVLAGAPEVAGAIALGVVIAGVGAATTGRSVVTVTVSGG
nr:hypothetical protein [Mycolicibacterium malmesburyense]